MLFAGFKDGGKTTTIARISRELVSQGKRVCTVKHIHDPDFTMDKSGKDTWKHFESGASPVIAVSPNKIFMVKRLEDPESAFAMLEGYLQSETADYLLVEGFYKEFAKRRAKTVICAATKNDVDRLNRFHRNPVFICGKFADQSKSTSYLGIPLLKLGRDIKSAVELLAEGPPAILSSSKVLPVPSSSLRS